MIPTTERARGHWRDILLLLGLEERFLSSRNGPCPMCGGKDRFRFSDKDGDGWYYCNQCGPGSGIVLLRRLRGWSHAEACGQVDNILGAGYGPPPTKNQPSRCDELKLAAIQRLLSGANSPEIVGSYLRSRGIAVSSPTLLGHPACAYFDEDHRIAGRFPAVVAPILAPDGKLVCAHRIYLADLEPRKKNMGALGSLKGAAVRLHDVNDEMGVGEGIETCLAAHQLFGIPMWAALTAYGVETFVPPSGLQRLHIFGDSDSNYTGQRATFALAHKLGRMLDVLVNIPPDPDTDWNDVLNQRARR